MHIDHNQFLELLTETSGIEPENVEKYIVELTNEINQAIKDGEAYEIDGFGIFSGIGNRILFIPSKELETEINFKYVGMEPIVLEEEQIKKEEVPEDNPFSDLQELESETESSRDPFAGLVEDFEDDSLEEDDREESLIFGVESTKSFDGEEEEFKPGPEEWGIEAHKEDDKGANKLLSSLMGEEFSEPDSEVSDEKMDEPEDDDIFGEDDEGTEKSENDSEESGSDLDDESSGLIAEEAPQIPATEMEAVLIDEDLTDVFGEEDELDEEFDLDSFQESESDDSEDETVNEVLNELISEDEERVFEDKVEAEDIDLEDFDDPFLDLEEDISNETEEDETEDIVPVITNISSGIESTKKEKPKTKPKEEKPETPKKEPQPAPVWLWIVLALVLVTGSTVGLGYFSIINIPGITPQVATNITVVTPPPVIPPVQVENTEQPPVEQESTNPVTPPPAQEQEEVTEVPVTVPVSNTSREVPVDQNKYGMNGVVNESANDGYTIVLYSLSIEANAFAKQQELTADGYRALLTPVASERYGTLWRVSIGQFASLTEAAIASESMDSKFKQSYFIKKITN
ncbi:MAG: SPOR domain-containing protein [Balneolaceae bacterium]